MFKQLGFRNKLFLYLSLIFIAFTTLVLIFQYEREKDFKKQQLEQSLSDIAELTHNFVNNNHLVEQEKLFLIDSISDIIPYENIRITLIDPKGLVMYDSEVDDVSTMENHLLRPEVQNSVISGFGSNVRTSSTTGHSYFYYSKFYTDYFVRTAALYNVKVVGFLKVERMFIVYLLGLFLIIWLVLNLITRRFGATITRLKDFVIQLGDGSIHSDHIEFPNDEFGAISAQVVEVYQKLNDAKEDISLEKNKLYSHLHALREGVAFFSAEKKKVLTNTHFIQLLNLLSDQSTISAEKIFDIKDLKLINRFVDEQLESDDEIDAEDLPLQEQDVFKNGKYFNIRCIFFQDKSFEIMITDTTKLEKRKMIKQQMTSNIAHELRTPVSSVMGYLETLESNNIEDDQRKQFISRAFSQAKRLSELIEDLSVLNNIEEAKEHFVFDELNVTNIVNEVHNDLKPKLEEKYINVEFDLKENIAINGNKSLLFSVFYNLFDNTIKYAGEKVEIKLKNYLEDKDFYYFSYSNTGTEIDKEHLSRIFERFYRVDSGRSRKSGGTGLGLAIVKNAIILHNGEITARNYSEGGVEFLFTLAK